MGQEYADAKLAVRYAGRGTTSKDLRFLDTLVTALYLGGLLID